MGCSSTAIATTTHSIILRVSNDSVVTRVVGLQCACCAGWRAGWHGVVVVVVIVVVVVVVVLVVLVVVLVEE